MEILSFAFGMLAMVAVALIAVVVVGMVKVIKMQKIISGIYNIITDNRKEMLSLHKESIDETIKVFEQVDKQLGDLNRYIDSRFDKMENKFIGNSAKKQINN